MSEEAKDCAVKAAKEWLGEPLNWKDCPCAICVATLQAHATKVAELAAVIRKHVTEYVKDYSCGCMRG